MRILFICAGNLCRSVIAECVLRARSLELLPDTSAAIESESGGIEAEESKPPHPDCLRALETLGIHDCATTSTRADVEHMQRSDLAITMTRQQSYVMEGKFPDYRRKCFSLVEINGAIETILEERGSSVGEHSVSDLRFDSVESLEKRLDLAASTLLGAPRELLRPLPGVPMSIQELMGQFAPCFYQVSGVHDPLGGTPEEIAACARQIEREVTLLLRGLLALAATEPD